MMKQLDALKCIRVHYLNGREKTMKKRVLSMILAGILAVAMAVPTFADEIVEEEVAVEEALAEDSIEEEEIITEDEIAEELSMDEVIEEDAVISDDAVIMESEDGEAVNGVVPTGRIEFDKAATMVVPGGYDSVYYSLKVPESGRVTVYYNIIGTRGQFSVRTLANDVVYNSSFYDGGSENAFYVNLLGGDYYFVLNRSYGEGWPSATVKLSFKAAGETVKDTVNNKHDTVLKAATFKGSSMKGLLAYNDHKDVFKYSLTKDAILNISYKANDMSNIDFALLNSDGQRIYLYENMAVGLSKYQFKLQKGVYYFALESGNGNDGGVYTLSTSVSSLAKPKISSVKKVTKNKVTYAKVSWGKVKNITKYQVQYSTSKDFKNAKKVTTSSTSKEIKIPAGKTYYYRVRAVYEAYDGETAYSAWSTAVKKKF